MPTAVTAASGASRRISCAVAISGEVWPAVPAAGQHDRDRSVRSAHRGFLRLEREPTTVVIRGLGRIDFLASILAAFAASPSCGRLAEENPDWGAPKIHGELLKLGFVVSERTVARYLRRIRRRGDPGKRWLAFLQNHREVIVAFDFFTVPTLTFQLLYCFFVIEHGRRRILHFNVTRHPSAEWVVQQLRETFRGVLLPSRAPAAPTCGDAREDPLDFSNIRRHWCHVIARYWLHTRAWCTLSVSQVQ